MKLLIITADKDTLKWKSLPRKLQVITNVINSGKNADWEVSIEYVHTTPVFFDGRILHEWLDAFIEPFFQKGYDVVGLHFSNEQRTQWGMKPTLGGSNPRSDKEFGQFYLWADEHSTRYGENRFIQNVLHEFKHEYHQQTGILDDTHTIDKRTRDVSNSFQKMDWALYQPVRQELKRKLSLYQQLAEAWRMVVALTNKKKPNAHPRFDFDYPVTQAYGVENSAYKLTGRHIGTDWACPKNTAIMAPFDGEVTKVGTTKALGNYCHFEYKYNGTTYVDRCLHLNKKPTKRTVTRGEMFALTGNTGFSTGYHSHIDVWIGQVDIASIDKYNWNLLTVDPDHIYS